MLFPSSCRTTSDLGLGSIYYRHLINLSSGWIHHSVYTFLFAYWLHQGWSHIAVMACVFEVRFRVSSGRIQLS